MKRIVVILTLILTLASLAAGQAKGKRPEREQLVSADQALKDLEREWMEGFKNQEYGNSQSRSGRRFYFH